MLYKSQGDVNFVATKKEAPTGATPRAGRVLAFGEVTGHKHAVVEEDAEVLVRPDGSMYLRAPSGATVVHEEHAPVTLPPGNYEVTIDREFDYASHMARNVAD